MDSLVKGNDILEWMTKHVKAKQWVADGHRRHEQEPRHLGKKPSTQKSINNIDYMKKTNSSPLTK